MGQHELLNAINYCQDVLHLPLAFEMEHLPFRLINPSILTEDTPKVDKSDFLLKHIGKERFAKLQAAVSKWADEKGIPMCAGMSILFLFLFLTWRYHGNSSFKGVMSQTTRAHRLCQKAYKIGGQNLQIPLLCAVFKAHMEDAKDIADINVLAELAESTGTMSKAEVYGTFPQNK